MFERFTDTSRQALVIAQNEAKELGHRFIGTEHILLGLSKQENTVARNALDKMGMTYHLVLQAVKGQIQGFEPIPAEEASPPFTPRAKKVLELSLREALQLGHNYIGTEHILLGLIREGEGIAAQILKTCDIDLAHARQTVISVLTVGGVPAEGTRPVQTKIKQALQGAQGLNTRLERIESLLISNQHRLERILEKLETDDG